MNCVLGALLVLVASAIVAVPARATEAGGKVTIGPGDYRQFDADGDLKVSKSVTVNLSGTRYESADTPVAWNYAAKLTGKITSDISSSVRLFFTPRSNRHSQLGIGLEGKYHVVAGSAPVTISFTVERIDHFQDVPLERIAGGGGSGTTRVSLGQNQVRPEARYDLPRGHGIFARYAYYFYDEDVSFLHDEYSFDFPPNVSFTGVIGILEGFPGSAGALGGKYRIRPGLTVEAEWTKIYLIVRRLYEDSLLLTLTAAAGPSWSISGSYNAVGGDDYYAVGLRRKW